MIFFSSLGVWGSEVLCSLWTSAAACKISHYCFSYCLCLMYRCLNHSYKATVSWIEMRIQWVLCLSLRGCSEIDLRKAQFDWCCYTPNNDRFRGQTTSVTCIISLITEINKQKDSVHMFSVHLCLFFFILLEHFIINNWYKKMFISYWSHS